jgi:hypothetical protein
MASILNVDQIGHSTSGTTAITIASDGKVTMPENDSGWIEPTLNSPYTHFGSPYGNAKYRKIGDIVNIQGLININSASNGDVIFTLPSGYRPKLHIIMAANNGGLSIARIDITQDGDVVKHSAVADSSWVSLFMTFIVS